MSKHVAPLRSPPPAPVLADFSVAPADPKAKFRAADAVIAAPQLSAPLREIVDAVSPLRNGPVKTESRRTPPMPPVLGLPRHRNEQQQTASTSAADAAIMSKALEAVRKPRLSSAVRGTPLLHPSVIMVPPKKATSTSKTASTLVKKFIDETNTSSSAEAMSTFEASTMGMTAKQRRAYILKRRADEARVQQLRGIFAAYDRDRDGHLTRDDLANCLLALGFDPKADVLSKFEAPADGTVDLATFVRVTMTKLEEPATTEKIIDTLFTEFDKDTSGRVPLSTLLHLLCEVDNATALTVEEVNELLKLTGIMSELQSRDVEEIYATEVDHTALVRHMIFPMSKKSTQSGGSAEVAASS